jgi:hypothetical protein
MAVRVMWTFPSRVPSYDGAPVLVEEPDELWWQSADTAQLYAVLTMKQIGAVKFRLDNPDG